MRLMHLSDNHSLFPRLDGDFDVILHTGDLLPNKTRGNRHVEPAYQKQWMIQNEDSFKKWIGDKTFLWVPGNHDFYDVTEMLNKFGINAINIADRKYTFMNYTFYGFPYIPWFGGEWNYELYPQQMIAKIDELVPMVNNGEIDVLAAHCPIYGILDQNQSREHCGNTAMKNAFEYKFTKLPKLYAHGHIHQVPELSSMQNPDGTEKMIISNAATTQRIIEL